MTNRYTSLLILCLTSPHPFHSSCVLFFISLQGRLNHLDVPLPLFFLVL